MKYHVTVYQWNCETLFDEKFNTIKEFQKALRDRFCRNLGQRQHFRDSCTCKVRRLSESMQKDLKNGVNIPECNLQYENYTYKPFESLKFKKDL